MSNSVKRNIAFAYIVQIVSMLTSVVMSLIVPKMLSIEEFSFWQLFMLYASYVSFSTLGLHDGIYLINGGLSRDQINKQSIGSQLFYMYLLQIVVGCVVILGSMLLLDDGRRLVFMMLGVYLVLFNIDGSLRVLFQAIDEVQLSSKALLILRSSFLVLLAVLLASNCQDYFNYIVAYVVAEAIACAYSLFHARDILLSKLLPLSLSIPAMRKSVSAGFKLMISMQISMLVVGLSRFFIEWFWPQYVFGQYSFAISLITFFNAFIVQAALVFFPFLRKTSEGVVRAFFIKSERAISALMPIVLICTFPLKSFIGMWLPQYNESLAYLVMLLPVCIFDSKMEICCSTLFKVRREETLLLQMNIASFLIALTANLCGTILRSVDMIIIGSVAAVAIRCVASERCLAKRLNNYEALALSAYLGFYSIVFIATSMFTQRWIALVISLALYLPLPIYLRLIRKREPADLIE